MVVRASFPFCLLVSGIALAGCSDPPVPPTVDAAPAAPPAESGPHERVDSRPAPLAQPVDLWEEGHVARQIDAATAAEEGFVLLDLGDDWTPYLFTERANASEPVVPNGYRATYLALARGEFGDDYHGERARRDKYLELYGILPTLGLLRDRFRDTRGRECASTLDPAPLTAYTEFLAYRDGEREKNELRRFQVIERQVQRIVAAKGVASEADLDLATLPERDQRNVNDYRRLAPKVRAVTAAQARLECEGYFELRERRRFVRGAFDWATHEALAEFEKRHRIFGWGYLGSDSREALSLPPVENERRAVLRVLVERAMHAAGVIEDGSAKEGDAPATFRGHDGRQHDVPNLEQAIEEQLVEAFGLQTPESTLAFLEQLGATAGEKLVAIHSPALPEYYSSDMRLSVVVDRGDVWYEFPYDEVGHERDQPRSARPMLTVYTEYESQRIPLARYGTTVGGWRSENVDGVEMWKYKNSPTGPRLWHQIVAAPVWLPPSSTPARELLRRGEDGEMHVNTHETGPSYASAYGLVAAYHATFREDAEGEFRLGGDEGIRTHGSVNYMSIMRKHSHGCHRLHNHIAVRLMSFVLAHRRHRRVGQHPVAFRMPLEHEGHTYNLEIDQGGYVYELEEPLPVSVLEGHIRGARMSPIEEPLPKFQEEYQAYVLPDGGAVAVSRTGLLTPIDFPVLDAGVDAETLDASTP